MISHGDDDLFPGFDTFLLRALDITENFKIFRHYMGIQITFQAFDVLSAALSFCGLLFLCCCFTLRCGHFCNLYNKSLWFARGSPFAGSCPFFCADYPPLCLVASSMKSGISLYPLTLWNLFSASSRATATHRSI